MPITVTINGQPTTLPDFTAFKAVHAMETLGAIESQVREIMHEAGDFRAEWMKRHSLSIPRAEARRQFRPEPLLKQETTEDGVSITPMLDDAGAVILGADPLAHLTDADWEASGNTLVVPEQPDDSAVQMALIPKAFKIARESVMELLSLAVVADRDVEQWDAAGELEEKLKVRGKALLFECKADELAKLAVAVIRLAREQVADPFDAARAEIQAMFSRPEDVDGEATAEPPIEPMSVEPPESDEPESETGSSPTSSTASPADTAGVPTPSSTAPAGVS